MAQKKPKPKTPRKTPAEEIPQSIGEMHASWKPALLPMYEAGRHSLEHWHQRAREAFDAVAAWGNGLAAGGELLPTPWPFMEPGRRDPNRHDLQWAYVVVGLLLDQVIGPPNTFILQDLDYRHLPDCHWRNGFERSAWEQSIFPVVYGNKASLDDYRAWWTYLEQDLREHGGGGHAAAGEQPSDTLPRGAAPIPYHDSGPAGVSIKARERIEDRRQRLRGKAHVEVERLLESDEVIEALRQQAKAALHGYVVGREESAGPLSWLWDGCRPEAERDLPGVTLFALLADEHFFGPAAVDAVLDDETAVEYEPAISEAIAEVENYYRYLPLFDRDVFPKCVKQLVDRFQAYVVNKESKPEAETMERPIADTPEQVLAGGVTSGAKVEQEMPHGARPDSAQDATNATRYEVSRAELGSGHYANVVEDLINDVERKGVKLNPKRHGAARAAQVRQWLKGKDKPQYASIAKAIATVKVARGTLVLKIPDKEIRLVK